MGVSSYQFLFKQIDRTNTYKMSLYPSLEDMKVDHMIQEQNQILQSFSPPNPAQTMSPQNSSLPYPTSPPSNYGSPNSPVYPGLAEYLPENQSLVPRQSGQLTSATATPASSAGGFVAPISSASPAFTRSQLTHGIRQVILCKDGAGKVGIKVKAIDKGIFVALVTQGSPAAMGGMKFGDQILQINNENVAGYTADKVHNIFKKAGVNNIVLAVRDRPFERTLTLHKDSTGHIGFMFKEGKITAIVVESSAARNGLLIEHNLLEVNGQNVVGMKDKDITKIIDEAGQVVTITVIPNFLYKHIMKNMHSSLVKKMDHSVADL